MKNSVLPTGVMAKAFERTAVDGRKVSLEEVVNIFKNAEKEGLVHQASNIQGSTALICNCCSCCCPYLKSYEKLGQASATVKSNFDPMWDRELCQLCETCVEICPMKALEHHWPHRADGSDDFIDRDANRCIGCGLCASNCPNQAISLKKVRDFIPVPTYPELFKKIKESVEH
jgi:formate hydrogenlyase subunit 6/NADH:ubiquinone oxidoreductase subunit I